MAELDESDGPEIEELKLLENLNVDELLGEGDQSLQDLLVTCLVQLLRDVSETVSQSNKMLLWLSWLRSR